MKTAGFRARAGAALRRPGRWCFRRRLRLPPSEKLGDEVGGRHGGDARVASKRRQEHHEAGVFARRIDDEVLATALFAQALGRGRTNEKAAQPVGKVTADKGQISSRAHVLSRRRS